jgi:hypothetical protein
MTFSCMKMKKMRPIETTLRRGRVVKKNDGRSKFN